MRNQRKQDDERISCEPNSPAACESICSGECCLPVLMLALSKHAIVVSSWPRQSICQSCCRWHCTGSHLSKQQTRATGAGERPAAAPNPPATSFIKHQRHVATEVTNPPLHRDRCASYYPQIQTNALGDLSGRHTDGAPCEQTTRPTGFVNSAARCVLCRRTRQAGMKTGEAAALHKLHSEGCGCCCWYSRVQAEHRVPSPAPPCSGRPLSHRRPTGGRRTAQPVPPFRSFNYGPENKSLKLHKLREPVGFYSMWRTKSPAPFP